MKNNVLYLRINSISGNDAREYLQILFRLNVGNVCPANDSLLWRGERIVLMGKRTADNGGERRMRVLSYPCKNQHPSRLRKTLEVY